MEKQKNVIAETSTEKMWDNVEVFVSGKRVKCNSMEYFNREILQNNKVKDVVINVHKYTPSAAQYITAFIEVTNKL